MEEYKRFYEYLCRSKTDSELKEIANPENDYAPTAIKAASDILKYGRIDYEETIKKQGGIISIPEPDVNKKQEDKDNHKHKKRHSWLIAITIFCCLIACATILSGISDLTHIIDSKRQSNNTVLGNVYIGDGDFLGLLFYFYDRNTFAFSTTSGTKISYGTYDMDGNAITLRIAKDTYYAVSLEDGNKIMINDSQLTKTTDNKWLIEVKKIFSDLEQE